MSEAWKNGSTREWRRIRQLVLDDNLLHNGGRCVPQIPEICTGHAETAHHTKGRKVTGDDPRFLVAACTACNLHIGDPTKLAAVDPEPRPATKW